MPDSAIIEILLAVLAVMIGVGSFMGAGRVGKQQTITAREGIDAQAYDRAKEIYESAIAQVEGQLKSLREQLTATEQAVAQLREENRDIRAENVELKLQIARLESALAKQGKRIDDQTTGDL